MHGHKQAFAATLPGGARIRGTLYPALPGGNAVTLTVAGVSGRGTGRLQIRASMPGMVLTPAHATLWGKDGRYQRKITLSMSGD